MCHQKYGPQSPNVPQAQITQQGFMGEVCQYAVYQVTALNHITRPNVHR